MGITDELRRVLLAGVGAMAITAEKSKELVDAFVAKGELTVEQGKVLNEELKRNVSDTVRQAREQTASVPKNVLDQLDEMSPEQREQLRKKLAEMESQQDEDGGKA